MAGRRPDPALIALVLITGVLVAALFAGCRPDRRSAPLQAGQAARVGNRAFSQSDAQQLFRRARRNQPSVTRASVADFLFTTEAVLRMADQADVKASPADLREAGAALFPGASAEQNERFVRRMALWRKLLLRAAGPKPTPSLQELQAKARELRRTSRVPATRGYAPLTTTTAARARAAYQQLAAGQTYEQVAQRYSNELTERTGAATVIGVTRNQLSGQLGRDLFSTSPGKPTPPRRYRGGWRLLLVSEATAAHPGMSAEQAQAVAHGVLITQPWMRRVNRSQVHLERQLRRSITCSPTWYVAQVCGHKDAGGRS